MTIALPKHPEAAPVSGSEGRAWLEWNADTDRIILSSAALRLLQFTISDAPQSEIAFGEFFDIPNRNKLAIAFEDILTQEGLVSVELLHQTSAGTQVLLFRGELDRSREGRIVVASLEDVTNSSDGHQQIAAKKRF
jgi:hypothetical protein